jgi:hypothetical protein
MLEATRASRKTQRREVYEDYKDGGCPYHKWHVEKSGIGINRYHFRWAQAHEDWTLSALRIR